MEINKGDRFLDVKNNKEFIISDVIKEENFEWYYIEAENVIFKGKLYEKWKNSLTKQAIINGIEGGYMKRLSN